MTHECERERAVRRYLPLARALAARYRHSDEPLEDLVQVACIGLLNAVDRFDPERGTAFASFAVPTILGELRRHFRDHTWAVRVPRDRQELYLRIERVRGELGSTLGRPPTVAELAKHLGAGEERVLQALELGRVCRAEPLETAAPVVDDGFERAEERAMLDELLRVLTPDEAQVVHLRFHEDLTQDAIAARLGINQMKVSRTLHRSLARLREAAA